MGEGQESEATGGWEGSHPAPASPGFRGQLAPSPGAWPQRGMREASDTGLDSLPSRPHGVLVASSLLSVCPGLSSTLGYITAGGGQPWTAGKGVVRGSEGL